MGIRYVVCLSLIRLFDLCGEKALFFTSSISCRRWYTPASSFLLIEETVCVALLVAVLRKLLMVFSFFIVLNSSPVIRTGCWK